ncbi:MAG: acyltransferase [Candidatus Contendobacter sp.]|nr:acyltransferase [Candidatus Contendobacter sp.]
MSIISDIHKIESARVCSGGFIDALTGLRGLAALWVMTFHLWLVISNAPSILIKFNQWSIDLTPLFSCGWIGVNIFFGLSGFLLFLPFAQIMLGLRERIYLGEYFKRRFLRLFPAYYLQIAILLLLSFVGMYPSISAKTLIYHLFMLQDLLPNQLINGVYWTLPVEFSFYIVLPILFVFLQRTGWLYFILSTLVLVFSYRIILFFLMQTVDTRNIKAIAMGQLPGRLDDFVFGMWSAFLYTKYSISTNGNSSKVELISLLGMFVGFFGIIVMIYWFYFNGINNYWSGEGNLVFFWNTITAIFTSILIFSIALNGKLAQRLLSNKLMFLLGIISYSLYLWHLVAIAWLIAYFQASPEYKSLLLPCGIVISVLLSVFSYRCIEHPFLKIRHAISGPPAD